MSIIEVNNLLKSYGKVEALKGISFEVGEGELFGFIGPDGSGKTSLFRIITTLILPDKGQVNVMGYDVIKEYKKIRQNIGYMPGRFSLYHDLTVEENLKFFASIFNATIKENYHLITDIYSHIEPFKDRKAGKLSGGMKQKLALSCALIHKPKLLVLDEPTTGVDAVSRKEFWEMLKNLKSQGITILVSTPYMDEASLCERVALIQDGNILNIDTPENIVNKNKKLLVSIKSDNKHQLINILRTYQFTASVYHFGQYIHYTDVRKEYDLKDIKEFLINNDIKEPEVAFIKPNIEDTFMELMEKTNG
jgi:ABC-2 type transport system ATP-binding protein